MYRICVLICVLGFLAGCAPEKKYKNPIVIIETNFGDVKVELYSEQAPISVGAFLSYVDSGYYEKATFYRVLRDDNQVTGVPKSSIIQGGIWHSNYKKQEQLKPIEHESTQSTKILHTAGAISLARTTPGSASTEFFICMEDQPGFDYGGKNNTDGQGYAAFGKVVEGWPVLSKIYGQPENNQVFTPLITIRNIKRGN